MKLKTISFEFWKAQWQAIRYLLKFGSYNVTLKQIRDFKIHYEKSSELYVFVNIHMFSWCFHFHFNPHNVSELLANIVIVDHIK